MVYIGGRPHNQAEDVRDYALWHQRYAEKITMSSDGQKPRKADKPFGSGRID
jgi:hypothetical protein